MISVSFGIRLTKIISYMYSNRFLVMVRKDKKKESASVDLHLFCLVCFNIYGSPHIHTYWFWVCTIQFLIVFRRHLWTSNTNKSNAHTMWFFFLSTLLGGNIFQRKRLSFRATKKVALKNCVMRLSNPLTTELKCRRQRINFWGLDTAVYSWLTLSCSSPKKLPSLILITWAYLAFYRNKGKVS